jgi:hypothetical protein
MARQTEADARILGGLPVIVIGRIYPAEPDVGIFDEQPEVEDICWSTGKPIPSHMWERLTDKDFDACKEALLEGAAEAAASYADYLYDQRRDRQLERSTYGMGAA